MKTLLLTILMGGLLGLPVASRATAGWDLVLAESAAVGGTQVQLRDVVEIEVPADVADLVLLATGRPGRTATLSRRTILRRLVSAGQAAGVRLRGADACNVRFTGRQISAERLYEEVRRALQPLVPVPVPGAPASWFELDIPDRQLNAAGQWQVNVQRQDVLQPGRNLVQVQVLDGEHNERFNVTATLHCFQEVARSRLDIAPQENLTDDRFTWEWRDLAGDSAGLALGRGAVAGQSAARNISAGRLLREADLKATPLIESGQPVELQVVRGGVAVTVRAFARQAGCLGQVIPVRNELTGRLVNAKIAGPGLVEWRR